MNKRFSTLVATALVACGMSVSAQGVYLKSGEVKDGSFVFLSNPVGTNDDLAVTTDGTLKLHSQITSVSATDSTIAVLDSMAWKVTKVAGTVPTYKFQNRVTGHFLSVKAKSNQGEAVITTTSAIDTWAIDDTHGLYAVSGDSAYYLDVTSSNIVVAATEGAKISSHSFMPRAMNNKITLNAAEFNKYIKGFTFADVNGRKDPSKTTTGEVNLLTEKTWMARPIHGNFGADVEDHADGTHIDMACDTLFFQLKSSYDAKKDSVNYLSLDTAYLKGTQPQTESYFFAGADSLKKADKSTKYMKDGKWVVAKNDSLYMFTVEYTYGNDSLAIHPIAIPVKLDVADATTGSNWATATATTPEVERPSTSNGFIVGLRTLSNAVALAVDKAAGSNVHGFTHANIKASGRVAAIGGDATIATGVAFVKSLNKYKNNVENADYNKYLVVGLNGQLTSQASKGNVAVPATQWVVAAGSANGLYTIMNREYPDEKYVGSFSVVKGADGKEIANTYVCNSTDTLYVEDAKCASVEDLITVSGHKYATTGYGYYDPAVLDNKKYKVASASPYLSALFMQAKEDSSLVLDESEKLFFLKKVNGAQFGAKAAGVDTLYRYSYQMVTSKGEFVYRDTDKNGYALTKDGANKPAVFLMTASGAANTYILVDTARTASEIASGITTLHKVGVNAQSITPAITISELSDRNDLFTVAELDAPSMLFTMPTHMNIFNNNDRLALGKNNFAVMAQAGNELKSDVFENDNFTLWFDTVNYVVDQKASYFISQGIKATEGEEAEEASAERMYLTLANADTVKANKDYAIENDYRLYFRPATRFGVDSLIVHNFDADKAAMVLDTAKTAARVADFKFQFLAEDGNDGAYTMKVNGKKVVSLNGLLVAKTTSDADMVVTLKAPDYATSNEGVAVSEVTVIAGEGQVTIAGAAGKKVVISNILGQVVANTVITSDNAVIAAPQGVVVVAVEGEEAVKAIVK